jgi:outer membrane receptor protein involved in Fe transport/outer membrane protein OmpA-like peptidoglycan-associated protein
MNGNETAVKPKHVFGSVCLALAIVAIAQHAAAQQSARSDELEEVVVTATKRSTTIETTPISITALTGQDLEERGITDLSSIVQSVPGVSMRTSGPGQTELEMRGMTSSGGNSSTVGFYLDDIPLTSPASAQNGKVVIDPNLYDLNRVEVLRGPQGTLYGAGSMGGTIKLVPNAPDPAAFDASGELILGHTDGGDTLNNGENAMVNLPLSDSAAVRIVGSQEHLSGWIDRKVISDLDFPAPASATIRGNVAAAPLAADFHDVNDEVLTSARIALLWNVTDRLSVAPSFMYQKITQDGLSLIDSQPGTNNQYQPYNSPEPFEDRIDIGALNLKYHFDIADLTSTTSYWTRDEELREDGAEEIAYAIGAPIYSSEGGAGPTSPTPLEDDKSKEYSEEIRLTSAGDTEFKWLVGYFYQDFESDWDLYITTPESAAGFGTTDGFTQVQPTKILQNSFFGEASYTFLQQFTVTAGLRRYYYHGSVNTAVSGWLSSSGTSSFDYYSTGERDSGVTPKLSLSYQLDKDLLLYGTLSQGFRPGGGNQPIPTTGALGTTCLTDLQAIGLSAAPLGFKPDKVWSYELGEKFRDGDGRFTVNSAAYFENWQHIQQNIPLSCGFPFTGNAGDAHIYGTELEISAVVVPGLVASVNGSWLHAEYIANAVPSTTIDERVQDVPELTASASLAYRHPINDSLGFLARVDNNYVGSRIDTTAQANYLGSYDLTNLRVGVEADHWSAAMFVNNVTNRVALLTNSPAINVNIPTFNRTAMEQPLTVGIDLTYHFGGGHATPAPATPPTPAPPPPPATPPAPAPPPPLPAPVSPPPPPVREQVLKGVNFETGSAKLRTESTAILDGVAATIAQCHCSKVDIRGYTDSVGKPPFNQKLSERRANAVKDYLEAHGVAPGILTAEGLGEANPIADNRTANGRAENRRVTVQFTTTVTSH